jgi:quercetin dioxygenase-like cupin family protein
MWRRDMRNRADGIVMRAILIGLGLSMTAVAASSAPPAKIDVAKLLAPTDKVVLHAKDMPQIEVYEWERDGVRYNAWPGDGNTPPYDAARLKLRAFSFPTGMIRELYYEKGTRTPPHANGEDIVMYGVSGMRVQIVNDRSHELGAGDVSFHPFGVSHHSESVISGSQVEFAFPGKLGPDPQATWISANDVPETPIAAWVRDGKQMMARGADYAGAPADAVKYTIKQFKSGNFGLLEIHLPKGAVSLPHTDTANGFVYVIKGHIKVHIGDIDDEVTTGDALYEPAGIRYSVEALDDTVLAKVNPPNPQAAAH